MVREDFKHIAQCCHSLNGCIAKDGESDRVFDQGEFDRFIDRLIWAIQSSPGGSPQFDHAKFVAECKGAVA